MKAISLISFLIVAAAQLFVPSKMIAEHESILMKGKEFHFKTAPIDPNDPFRGKYITLSFDANRFAAKSDSEWDYGETIYAAIAADSNGFAKIISLEKEIPTGNKDFVKAKIQYISNEDEKYFAILEYPFETYYMEESKAGKAETIYHNAAIDSNQIACAIVKVLNGEALVSDVLINGKSIKELSAVDMEK